MHKNTSAMRYVLLGMAALLSANTAARADDLALHCQATGASDKPDPIIVSDTAFNAWIDLSNSRIRFAWANSDNHTMFDVPVIVTAINYSWTLSMGSQVPFAIERKSGVATEHSSGDVWKYLCTPTSDPKPEMKF